MITHGDLPQELNLASWFVARNVEEGRDGRTALIGPAGKTTYGELARRVGHPRAARAVGTVMNRNRIPIVLPCHRVVGSTGDLTGYGGGLDRKRTLLELEGAR